MTRITPTDDLATDASRLDLLVAEMSARVETGQAIDLTALTADCPELREQLEMLLPTLQAVVDLERSVDENGAGSTRSPAVLEHEHHGNLGDFRLIREIGRGGMGVVYEAEQISLGRSVAVKVLPFAAMLDERQLARFKNEARAAASLQHPHIVPVHFVGVERGVHYYAMQFVEGQSLGEMRSAECGVRNEEANATSFPNSAFRTPHSALQPLAHAATHPDIASPAHFRRIAALGVQAARALNYAHESGVVHRDVKPSNLLVEPNGHLWVTDFGLARLETDVGMTMTGDLLGTLRYMSPEQASGQPALVDYRTDIYALGATLYELLASRPPFEANDRRQLLRQIHDESPPPLRRSNPRIPADLETIVLKAMAKEIPARYATAQALADDLQRFLDAKAIIARRPTLVDRAVMWSRRHVALVLVAGAALLTTTIVAAVAAVLINGARGEAERQAQQAEHRLRFAREVVDEMYTSVAEAWLANQPAMTPLQQSFLEKAARFYQNLADSAPDDPQSQAEAATARLRLAEMFIPLARHDEQEVLLRDAMAQLDRQIAAHPDEADFQRLWAQAAMMLGAGLAEQNRLDEARDLFTAAQRRWQALADRRPVRRLDQQALADITQNLGQLLTANDPQAAESQLRSAVAAYERLLMGNPRPDHARYELAGAQVNLAVAIARQRRLDDARDVLEAALANLDQARSLRALPELRQTAAWAWHTLALVHSANGQRDEAERALDAAADIFATLIAQYPDRAQYREFFDHVGVCQEKLAAGESSSLSLDHDLFGSLKSTIVQ